MNAVAITLTKKNGDSTTATQLFNPEKMFNVKADPTVATYLGFDYPEPTLADPGAISKYVTSTLSLTSLANSINSTAPSGSQAYVGRINTTSGFAIGTHDILDTQGNPITIPDNSRIWWGYYEVAVTFTSATDAATISLSIATDDVAGLKAATAISTGTTYDATGAPVLLIPQYTIGTVSERTTAARKLQYAIAGETVTAGDLECFFLVITGI